MRQVTEELNCRNLVDLAAKEYISRIVNCYEYTSHVKSTSFNFDKELFDMMSCKLKSTPNKFRLNHTASRNYSLPEGEVEYDFTIQAKPVYNFPRHFCTTKCAGFDCKNDMPYICIVCGGTACTCGSNLGVHVEERFKSSKSMIISGGTTVFQKDSEQLGLEIYLATILNSKFAYKSNEQDALAFDSFKGLFFELIEFQTADRFIVMGDIRIEQYLNMALDFINFRDIGSAFAVLLDLLCRYNILFELAYNRENCGYKNMFSEKSWQFEGLRPLKPLPEARPSGTDVGNRFRNFLIEAEALLGKIGQDPAKSRIRTYISLAKLLYDALLPLVVTAPIPEFMKFNVYKTGDAIYSDFEELAREIGISKNILTLRGSLEDTAALSAHNFEALTLNMRSVIEKIRTYNFPAMVVSGSSQRQGDFLQRRAG